MNQGEHFPLSILFRLSGNGLLSEVNTVDKSLLPFFHYCSLPPSLHTFRPPSLPSSLFSYLSLVPFHLVSLLPSSCLLSSLTSFFSSLSPSFTPLKFPYLSSFLLLSLLSPIPTSPPFWHILHPDTQETSSPTLSSLLAFLFLIRQAVHSVFQMLILDSKQRPCAFPS